ncbi:hypothetical protein AVEN_269805-1 [Araneus ventricosus]|uniref:Uncharacterized protein n=1 Tax=Araneus ventricosus TaxID=182803 RepID=A0A4Y2JIY1_ARAVE|nr:hypothetical protein AVEN_269805-1 [Araneus ventricosus]
MNVSNRTGFETVPNELAGAISSLIQETNQPVFCWKNSVRFLKFHVNSSKIRLEVRVCIQTPKKFAASLGKTASPDPKILTRPLFPVPRAAKIDLLLKTQNHLFISLKVCS